MPFNGYLVFNYLHILSAALLVGALAAFPFLRREAERSGDAAFAAHAARALNRLANVVLVPAVVLLFVTGILMSAGPFARWNMFLPDGRWILWGMAAWVVLAGAVGFLVGVVKQMAAEPAREAARGGRFRPLWRQYRWALLASAVLAAAAEAIMVFKPAL